MPTLKLTLDMDPPRTTHQQKKARIVKTGNTVKPMFYEPDALRMARREYMLRLARLKPDEPIKGPVKLITIFSYKAKTKKQNGQPKVTRPDTDNMIKLLKDCMTACGFWEDDSQVYDDRVIKRYSERPCVNIEITWGEEIKERDI